MKIVEVKTEADFDYKNFFLRGLREHEDFFRISPQDELQSPFPTQSRADSFTLGAISDAGELFGVVSFEREGAMRENFVTKVCCFECTSRKRRAAKASANF